jgi:Uma2 family endonuclease
MVEQVRRPGFPYMAFDDFEEMLADKPEHEKWELIGGRVVKMMVAARWEHHAIVRNIQVFLSNLFRARQSVCRSYAETFGLKEQLLDLTAFPDVMVRCGRLPPDAASTNDPVVLFEVVSEGSAYRDRIEKKALYQRLSSLQHYVLVERDRPAVEVYDRGEDERWIGTRQVDGLEETLLLPAIEAEMPMSEIYFDVFER